MSHQPVWLEHLKPWLLERAKYSRVDPKEVANLGSGDKDEYLWRSLQRDIFVGVVEEIMAYVDNAINTVEYLRKKKKGEIVEKDFQIGK